MSRSQMAIRLLGLVVAMFAIAALLVGRGGEEAPTVETAEQADVVEAGADAGQRAADTGHGAATEGGAHVAPRAATPREPQRRGDPVQADRAAASDREATAGSGGRAPAGAAAAAEAEAPRDRAGFPAPPDDLPTMHESGLPYEDAFAHPELVERFRDAIPQLGECLELVRELNADVPPEVTLQLEALFVAADEDPSRGRIDLQNIDTDVLRIDDVACFAEVFDRLEVPAPEGAGFAFRLQTSMRLE